MLAAYPSRSPAQFGRPPSLLGGLGAFAASSQSPFGSSSSPFGSSPFGSSPFGSSPFGAPPVAPLSAEYGAPSGAGGGAPAPLERVLAALRQERVLSETQLADLGVSPSALKSLGVDFDRYLTNQVFVSNVCPVAVQHCKKLTCCTCGLRYSRQFRLDDFEVYSSYSWPIRSITTTCAARFRQQVASSASSCRRPAPETTSAIRAMELWLSRTSTTRFRSLAH